MANQKGETTSIGHFYNRCVDAVNNLFDTMSFWTHSKDVEFVDGKTAETKVGAINGITSDISGEADDIAASIKCVNELNSSLASLEWQLIGQNLSSIDLTQWRFLKIGSIASGVLYNTVDIELSITNDIDFAYLQSYISDTIYTKVNLSDGTCTKGSDTRSVFWGRK